MIENSKLMIFDIEENYHCSDIDEKPVSHYISGYAYILLKPKHVNKGALSLTSF